MGFAMTEMAPAKPRFVTRAIWAPAANSRPQATWHQVGTRKVERPSLFGRTKQVDKPGLGLKGEDVAVPQGTHCVDLEAMAIAIDTICTDLDQEGYEVISINPVTSGRSFSQHQKEEQWGKPYAWALGYGFSITDGLLITGRRRD
jgi:hypothetical protein